MIQDILFQKSPKLVIEFSSVEYTTDFKLIII